jgi:PEP-CTERM motif
MKLKLIALAVAALVSGAANAAIDNGVAGNGNVIFTAWDTTSSYTLNTGYTVDSFNAAVTAGINYSFSDALLTSWLSTAAVDAKWTMIGLDFKTPFRTVTTSDGSNAGTMNSSTAKSVGTANSLFINDGLNLGGPFSTVGVIDAVSLAGTASYTGLSSLAFGESGYVLNFNSNGTLANNTAATGLSVINIGSSGALTSTFSVYTPFASSGAPVTAWVAADKSFNIGSVTAVPEPESLAMLLAGMGVVGTMAARRRRFTA